MGNETGEGTGTTGVTVSHVTETGVTEEETVKRDGETEVAAGPGAPEVTSTRRASETEAKRKTSRRSKSSVKSKKSRQTSESQTPGLLYITIYCVIFVCCGVSQPGLTTHALRSSLNQLSFFLPCF